MSTQERPTAEILIGKRNADTKGRPLGEQYCFTLYISGEMILAPKMSGWKNPYLSFCRTAALDFSRSMVKREIFAYTLVNGKRGRHTTHEIVVCGEMPVDGVAVFQRVLDVLQHKPFPHFR